MKKRMKVLTARLLENEPLESDSDFDSECDLDSLDSSNPDSITEEVEVVADSIEEEEEEEEEDGVANV